MNIQRIKTIRKYLTRESCTQLVQSFVISHLDYCGSLLYGLPSYNIKKLQRIQNWSAKLVLQRGRLENSFQALFDLKWLPMQQRIHFRILTQVYKCLIKEAPGYLKELIKIKEYNRPTRLSCSAGIKLVVPRTKCSTFASRAFSVAGPELWNGLPLNVRSAKTLNDFQRLLKRHLLSTIFSDFINS